MQQQAAAGTGAATLEELMAAYDAFVAKAGDGSSAEGMTDEEFAAWLNSP